MNLSEKGMMNYYDQQKDRENWKKSIDERNALVAEIKRRGIKTAKSPHEMKLKDLRDLILYERG